MVDRQVRDCGDRVRHWIVDARPGLPRVPTDGLLPDPLRPAPLRGLAPPLRERGEREITGYEPLEGSLPYRATPLLDSKTGILLLLYYSPA